MDELPKIKLKSDGRVNTYILEAWLHKKRKRNSWIQPHVNCLVRLNPDDTHEDVFLCKHCESIGITKLFDGEATTPAGRHLKKQHRIFPDGELQDQDGDEPLAKRQAIIDFAKTSSSDKSSQRLVVRTAAEEFKNLLMGWIIDANIPFYGIEHPLFRELLLVLNRDFINELLPESADAVKNWITMEYETRKTLLKREFQVSRSKIHITFDLWTSPNNIALLSIIAHFVDTSGKLQIRLLSLERVEGSHGGENQARIMVQLFRDFDISKKVGFFTADNADSCDTAVRAILKALKPHLTEYQRVKLERQVRIRCFGHVLNLSAKAFLEGASSEIFDSAYNKDNLDVDTELRLLKEWRKYGPVGKLHNAVHFIRRSSQRRDQFLAITTGRIRADVLQELGLWLIEKDVVGLMVKADNDTRWNSIYLMILRAIKLKDIIDTFCRLSRTDEKPEKRIPEEDVLQHEDWLVLTEILEILKPYIEYTKYFEGREPRFAEVISTVCCLQDHLKEMQKRYNEGLVGTPFETPQIDLEEPSFGSSDSAESCIFVAGDESQMPRRSQREIRLPTRLQDFEVDISSPRQASSIPQSRSSPPESPRATEELQLGDLSLRYIQHSLEFASKKLEKYRNLMEETGVYWAAMILHPAHKTRLIEVYYPERKEAIVKDFRALFDDSYVDRASGSSQPVPQNAQAKKTKTPWITKGNYYQTQQPRLIDEIEDYLSEPPRPLAEEETNQGGGEEAEDLISWWISRKGKWPRLYRMAIDFLTIPAMSSECERCFSVAKLQISSQRHRQHFATMKSCQCLKNWARMGMFNWKEMGVSKASGESSGG